MKIVFILIGILLLVIGLSVFAGTRIGANKAAEAEAENAQIAARTQEFLDKLPDSVRNVIVAIAALIGLDVFGRYFMLTIAIIVQTLVSVLVIGGLNVPLSFRSATEASHKYTFLTSVVIAGLVMVGSGLLLTGLPGGEQAFQIELLAIGGIVFLSLGGGFSFRGPRFRHNLNMTEHGTTSDTQFDSPTLTVTSGAGRGYKSKVTKDGTTFEEWD